MSVENTWDCIHGSCLNPGTGVGIYSSLAACQAACGCVVGDGDGDNVDCTKGIDAIFLVDYTGSMGPSVSVVKTGVASTVATIQGLMGATSEYRLSLVLADESWTSPTYGNSNDYIALPANQKVNVGSGVQYSITQHYTAVETFATNNINTFQTQVNKIDTGPAPSGWPMGDGVNIPEPTDVLLEMCVDSANTNYPFAGQWRAGVAKYVFIYTDAPPSGTDDDFGVPDTARLSQLEATCVANCIKVFVLGYGVYWHEDGYYSGGGGDSGQYPWRKLAEGTGGAWDESFASGTLNQLIVDGCASGSGCSDLTSTHSWDCIHGSCLISGTGVGIYSSLATCQAACGCGDGGGDDGGGDDDGGSTWDCIMGGCYDLGTGTGTYTSLTACQANCVDSTPGCTDNTAFNYNPSATIDDGSCTYPASGCTDPTATNYDPAAIVDDGSCTYSISGCTDPTATNYNALATTNDGSCTYSVFGCMDPTATNYDPAATIDNGSCTYPVLGCTNPLALNYNALATIDDSSCTYDPSPITGCTDPTATNYDPAAIVDDGSCTYAISGCTDPTAINYNPAATVDDGSCTYAISGCTNPLALNYNALATVDDGSCTYPTVSGCTDPLALNYNALATIACTPYINGNPGCCNYPITGCTDPTATNYNATATSDDGSCIYSNLGCPTVADQYNNGFTGTCGLIPCYSQITTWNGGSCNSPGDPTAPGQAFFGANPTPATTVPGTFANINQMYDWIATNDPSVANLSEYVFIQAGTQYNGGCYPIGGGGNYRAIRRIALGYNGYTAATNYWTPIINVPTYNWPYVYALQVPSFSHIPDLINHLTGLGYSISAPYTLGNINSQIASQGNMGQTDQLTGIYAMSSQNEIVCPCWSNMPSYQQSGCYNP
jgi:hypothetical protein